MGCVAFLATASMAQTTQKPADEKAKVEKVADKENAKADTKASCNEAKAKGKSCSKNKKECCDKSKKSCDKSKASADGKACCSKGKKASADGKACCSKDKAKASAEGEAKKVKKTDSKTAQAPKQASGINKK